MRSLSCFQPVSRPNGISLGPSGRRRRRASAICINGLWRWQPAGADAGDPPAKDWGYFKVPGCWPGITDYMQKDCQTVFAHPSWKNENLAECDGGLVSSAKSRFPAIGPGAGSRSRPSM